MEISETSVPTTFGEWHLRIWEARVVKLDASQWQAHDVCSPFWRFYVNDRDGMIVELDGKAQNRLELRAGQMYFLPQGVRFDGHTHAPVEHFYIHFEVLGPPPLLFGSEKNALFRAPMEVPLAPASRDEAWPSALTHLIEPCRALPAETPPAPALALHLKSLLYAALAACLEVELPALDAASRVEDLEPLRAALEHIEAHLGEPLSNARLAQKCGFCEDHFIAKFRLGIGQTPARYVLERRVAAAAQRLLFSEASIEQIAAATGFCDRFHLSRAFARHFGFSPAAYRKRRL